jgi:hypothetical protein
MRLEGKSAKKRHFRLIFGTRGARGRSNKPLYWAALFVFSLTEWRFSAILPIRCGVKFFYANHGSR